MVCVKEGQGLYAWSDSSIPASLGAGVAPCLADGPACRISIVIYAIYRRLAGRRRACQASWCALSLVKLTSDCLNVGASSSLSNTITS